MSNLPDAHVPPDLKRSEKLAAQSSERARTRKVVVHASNSPNDRPVADIGGAMTVAEFCRWGRIGRTKAYDLFKAGDITPRKIGAKTVILRSDAEAWLRSLPTAI